MAEDKDQLIDPNKFSLSELIKMTYRSQKELEVKVNTIDKHLSELLVNNDVKMLAEKVVVIEKNSQDLPMLHSRVNELEKWKQEENKRADEQKKMWWGIIVALLGSIGTVVIHLIKNMG